jgi:hypothetical protein
MSLTLTQQADAVLKHLQGLKPVLEEGPEKEFRRAVWSLCQAAKELQTSSDGGQIVPHQPLMP